MKIISGGLAFKLKLGQKVGTAIQVLLIIEILKVDYNFDMITYNTSPRPLQELSYILSPV